MWRSARNQGIFVLLGICFFCQDSFSQNPDILRSPHVRTLRFDSVWWNQADGDEQQGFLYGYEDCFQPKHPPNVSIDEEQNFVAGALQSEKRESVPAAIRYSWKTVQSTPILQGAEMWSGPHGYLDGGVWGGFEGQAWPFKVTGEDRGYIEGYLECDAPPVTVTEVKHYQSAMNRHYASGRYEHDKMAIVLQNLMKSAQKSRP
jgi:hypothetical protein